MSIEISASSRKLISSAGIYTLASGINSAIPFFLLPIMTRYLSPADYGLVATFQILVGFVSPFVGLSIQGAITRQYFDENKVDFAQYVYNCMLILLFSGALVVIVLILFGDEIGSLVTFPREWLVAVAVVAVANFTAQVVLSIWIAQKKSVKYGVFQISVTAINFGLSLWLVMLLHYGWEGRVWGVITASVISMIMGLYFLWKEELLVFKYKWECVASALKFGVPLLPHAFAGWAMVSIDRVYINNIVGVSSTGIYTVAFQIAMIITLIELSVNSAIVPWLYESLAKNNHELKIRIVKYSYMYIMVILSIGAVLSIAAPYLIESFLGKEFHGASDYITFLVMAKALHSIYFMTVNYIFYVRKTMYLAAATFMSAVFHAIVSYYLITINGVVGAAQATLMTSVVLVGLVWYLSAKVYSMPWTLRSSL